MTKVLKLELKPMALFLCPGMDWVCVSPKANTEVVVRHGDELKLVVIQKNWEPALFESWDFDHFFLHPWMGRI
jgi:hypothetical protein